jgi:hypothetical protein
MIPGIDKMMDGRSFVVEMRADRCWEVLIRRVRMMMIEMKVMT